MDNKYDKNNWYDRNGVARPAHIPFLTDEELARKFEEIRKSTVHGDWVQEGNKITCQKCTPQHGDTIPTDYLLQGTDSKGLPVLKRIDISKI